MERPIRQKCGRNWPTEQIADMMRMLAEPQRLRILAIIRKHQPITVAAIMKRLRPEPPQSSLSTHLRILVRYGLVRSSRAGQTRLYSLDESGVAAVIAAFRILTGVDIRG